MDYAQPLHGWPRTFGIDLVSPSLATLAGKKVPAAGGHWTIEATGSLRARKLFALEINPNSATRPSVCTREAVARARITVCRVPSHTQGGGYYGGHVTAEWRDGAAAVQITAHGYANRPRVLALIASVITRAHP